MNRPRNRRLLLTASLVLIFAAPAGAQTYKLGVKPDLKPQATLQLDGTTLKRSDVTDDPGFRLQYHFKKDGKTAAEVEARSTAELALPLKEAGTYTVTLELFYPNYKGGGAQKGEFKPISNLLTLKVEAGAKPEDPVKVTVIDPPAEPKK